MDCNQSGGIVEGGNTCLDKATGLKKWTSGFYSEISEKVGEVRTALKKGKYKTYFKK